MSNRILIFGANGMLGHKLVQILGAENDVWACMRPNAAAIVPAEIFDNARIEILDDILDANRLSALIQKLAPDVMINAAGVIKQVPEARDISTLIDINAVFPHRLAALGSQFGTRVITIGTDCVFSGRKGRYRETDKPDAEDLYGRSKLLGELSDEHCITLRTSIIGREIGTKHSLVEWFLANRGGKVNGFTNAIYSGMPTIVFADVIRRLIRLRSAISGIYHVASSPISKYELLKKLNIAYKANIIIQPLTEPVIDRSLDGSAFTAATSIAIPDWDTMIDAMCSDTTPYDRI